MKKRSVLMLAAVVVAVALPATAAQAAGTYSVTISSSKQGLVIGSTSQLSGAVSPKAAKQPVELQKKAGSKWKVSKTFKTAANSSYKVSVRPSAAGTSIYRVCKPASKKKTVKGGCSAPVSITTYRWHYLTDLTRYDADDIYTSGYTVNINGVTYKKSMYQSTYGSDAFAEYNLSRKCTTFVSTFGLNDDLSDSGSSASIEVLGDGNSLFSGSYGVGASEAKQISVSNVLRIRFEMTSLDDRKDVSAALGSPRVLCRF